MQLFKKILPPLLQEGCCPGDGKIRRETLSGNDLFVCVQVAADDSAVCELSPFLRLAQSDWNDPHPLTLLAGSEAAKLFSPTLSHARSKNRKRAALRPFPCQACVCCSAPSRIFRVHVTGSFSTNDSSIYRSWAGIAARL